MASHAAVMTSHAAVMAALAAIRGLPADQQGDCGSPSKKRKKNGARERNNVSEVKQCDY
jgi:hypothetical protein